MIDHSLLHISSLKVLVDRYHLSPSKHYGQHYLISEGVVRRILDAAELTQEDVIIEIGPGFGVLTLAMAPLVRRVIAFEIEKKLQPYWEEKQRERSNIEMVWGNVLNQFEPKRYTLNPERYKVVANLPYQITSDALRIIFEADPPPESIVVMVQKEVADRMCARPPDMGLLSVAVQYHGTPAIVTVVPAGSFWPMPRVDSAVVKINTAREYVSTRVHEQVADKREFFRVVRAGFSQKRRQLWHNLASGLHLDGDLVKRAITETIGNEKVRAQELSVEQWKKIVERLTAHTAK